MEKAVGRTVPVCIPAPGAGRSYKCSQDAEVGALPAPNPLQSGFHRGSLPLRLPILLSELAHKVGRLIEKLPPTIDQYIVSTDYDEYRALALGAMSAAQLRRTRLVVDQLVAAMEAGDLHARFFFSDE